MPNGAAKAWTGRPSQFSSVARDRTSSTTRSRLDRLSARVARWLPNCTPSRASAWICGRFIRFTGGSNSGSQAAAVPTNQGLRTVARANDDRGGWDLSGQARRLHIDDPLRPRYHVGSHRRRDQTLEINVSSDSAKSLDLPNWAIIPPKEDKKRLCPEAYAGDLLCYIHMKNFNSFH